MARPPKKLTYPVANIHVWFEAFGQVSNAHRMRLMLLEDIWSGVAMTRAELASSYGVSTRQLQRWVKIFNEQGIQGLRRSRPRLKIDAEVIADLIIPARDTFYTRTNRIPSPRELFSEMQSQGTPRFSYSTFVKAIKRSGLLATARKLLTFNDFRFGIKETPLGPMFEKREPSQP